MGIISIDKMNQLYWLGRYTERVFTTIQAYSGYYDRMIDQEEDAYVEFCSRLSIPNIYATKEEFITGYLYDESNPDSLYANLTRAFDNAVTLREEISSDVLCYIQMSLDKMKEQGKRQGDLMGLQVVMDYLYAFWGSADDNVLNEECRNIMKCGKYEERLDLYLRFSYKKDKIEKELQKFMNRLKKVPMYYDQEKLMILQGIVMGNAMGESERREALKILEGIVGGM